MAPHFLLIFNTVVYLVLVSPHTQPHPVGLLCKSVSLCTVHSRPPILRCSIGIMISLCGQGYQQLPCLNVSSRSRTKRANSQLVFYLPLLYSGKMARLKLQLAVYTSHSSYYCMNITSARYTSTHVERETGFFFFWLICFLFNLAALPARPACISSAPAGRAAASTEARSRENSPRRSIARDRQGIPREQKANLHFFLSRPVSSTRVPKT